MGEQRNITLEQALDFGLQMHQSGQYDAAIGLFRGVLMHDPKNFEAITRLGGSLFEQKKYHEALYWFWRGRKLSRRHPLALTNYGLCLSQLGHPDEGVPELEKAAFQAEKANMPADVKSLVYNNLGNALERIGRHAEALRALDKGIAHNPKHGFAYYNRGIALLKLNREREAIDSFNVALDLNPNDHDARYNRGIARLRLGEFDLGFLDYEARLVTSENEIPNFNLPADKKLLFGQDIEGKVVLVHGEQGLGDDIQFFRYLPLLACRGAAEIKVVCHTATKPFLDGFPVTQLQTGQPLGEYDYWVALMSLPHYLGTNSEADIPPPAHGLQIDEQRKQHWMELAKCVDRRLNVGVCWAGNFRHKNDLNRSIALQTFKAVFDIPHCNFISLQQLRPGEVDAFAELQVHYNDRITAFELTDFRDTAAIILNLDVVLTVDTAVAHLAGTLGVPTKILLPAYSTDWRWQKNRSDSPWYPSAILYRQPKTGDWDTPLDRAIADIGLLARTSRLNQP